MKFVRLSALRTDRLYHSRKYSWHSFLLGLSQPQGHSVAGRIMSMKISIDTIRDRTRNLRLVAHYLNQMRHRAPLMLDKVKENILSCIVWKYKLRSSSSCGVKLVLCVSCRELMAVDVKNCLGFSELHSAYRLAGCRLQNCRDETVPV